MTDWKKIREEWETSDITFVDLADKHNLKASTVRSRKNREKWQRNKSIKQRNVATNKSNATEKKKVVDDGTRETMLNENLTHEQRLFCIYYSKSFNAVQSYQKAYQCSYENACSHAWELWKNEEIRKEIQRLNEIKRQQILVNESDMVELHMRIAFADIGDYISFGQEEVPVMAMYGPVQVVDEETGKKVPLTKTINVVRAKESANVDTQIIQEVKQGREGFAIKLADKQKSLDWLEKFFLMNPMDKHKIDYDNKKLEFEHKKIEPEQVSSDGIKEFLKAIRPSEEDLKELFADEVIEDGEENTEE